MHEEIGIRAEDLHGDLIFIGMNFQKYDDDKRNFHDREYASIYTQRLKPSGIPLLCPKEDEVERLIFISKNSIAIFIANGKWRPALKATLPIYMNWFTHNRTLIFEDLF